MDYRILPPEGIIEDGVIDLPLSKSMLNRALLMAALTDGEPLPPPVDGEAFDIKVMREALETLRFETGGPVEVNAGESATALRFLTAYSAVKPGCEVILTGSEGLLRRPVGPLVEALRELGAGVEYLGEEGFAPLRVIGCAMQGGRVTVDASVSSQYVSALMIIAPLMEQGLEIAFDGEPASLPYIKMTARMLERRGIAVELAPLSVKVGSGSYSDTNEKIEADWSAAAFWYEVVALSAGWISLKGLTPPEESIQGDAVAAEYYECLGVETGTSEDVEGALALSPSPEVFGRLDLDLRDYPDLAPSLAVTSAMLGVPFRFVGLSALSLKESDRLQAIVEELDKIGIVVEKIRDFGLEFEGKRHPIIELPVFDPRGDHRLAMALAPVAAYVPGIVVKGAECVAKSYPGFWDGMRRLGFRLLDPSVQIDFDGDGEEA